MVVFLFRLAKANNGRRFLGKRISFKSAWSILLSFSAIGRKFISQRVSCLGRDLNRSLFNFRTFSPFCRFLGNSNDAFILFCPVSAGTRILNKRTNNLRSNFYILNNFKRRPFLGNGQKTGKTHASI